MNELYRKMMSSYDQTTDRDARTARYKAAQEIILSGLYHGGFFEKAAFGGGSCLRVFHGLNRFSEDMDFWLSEGVGTRLDMERFMSHVRDEFALVGREVEIRRREPMAQAGEARVAAYDIISVADKPQKIRIEVDAAPAPFESELRLALKPRSYLARCVALPDLFAGKMGAMLTRGAGGRAKGRDWYDFEWFVKNGVAADLRHLAQRTGSEPTPEAMGEMLLRRVREVDFAQARQDIAPFVADSPALGIWSAEYFAQLVGLISWR